MTSRHSLAQSPANRFSLLASRFSKAALLGAAIALAAPAGRAQDVSNIGLSQEVENSRFTTGGLISSNAVYVRCGPGDNYYPTQKLDKGAKVKVVGAKFDWLKIEPPEGSFCYVAKLYVDRHGDGKVGRVNKDSINVRAGSQLSALKIGILCELHQGEEVEILGDEQEYFKIKPPAGAYLYVNKRFVDPDPEAKPEAQASKPDTQKPIEVAKADAPGAPGPKPGPDPANPGETIDLDGGNNTPPTKPEPDPQPEKAKPDDTATPGTNPPVETPKTDTPITESPKTDTPITESPKTDTPITESPRTDEPKTTRTTPDTTSPPLTRTPKTSAKPPAADQTEAPPKPAATQAAKPSEKTPADWTPEQAESEFDKAEAEYFATRNQGVNEQPLESLIQRYEALSRTDKIPESMRRVAEARLPGLQARATAKSEIARLRSSEETLRQKQMALKAEQEELTRRIAERTIQVFTAVGTLQTSSLQQGQGTLYRITDPATGRTVCYLRSNDNKKVVEHLGQFVGIKGQITDDPRLGARVVIPTDFAAIDPAKVHTTITAQIIPPSLIPREASTDPNAQ
jgi:uncharacterized protein YgiM (DUF1202 family)